MINTSKVQPRAVQVEGVKTRLPSLGYDLRKHSLTLLLSYVQIVLAILAGYILISYSSKTGKDAWGGMFAIIPLFLIAVISPVMIVCAVYYIVRKKDGSIFDKISIVAATLMSIAALYIAAK